MSTKSSFLRRIVVIAVIAVVVEIATAFLVYPKWPEALAATGAHEIAQIHLIPTNGHRLASLRGLDRRIDLEHRGRSPEQFDAPFNAERSPASPTAHQVLQDPDVIADVAERVLPSVVNVSSSGVSKVGEMGMPGLPDDPLFEQFFGHHFEFRIPEGEQRHEGLGSGVIVSSDGLVLTNAHVVDDADEIRVTLSDGRDFEAEVVGTDPHTDIAVLRLKGDHIADLHPATFGDSDDLRLGEIVLAVGNPFGLTGSVTMGIVSAKGRAGMGITDYEDFIQTDAAINPGNSGGALVDLDGNLVGINTAILSRSGGYQGVGLAIPGDMARLVMQRLIEDGEVVRGWLGVGIQDLTPDIADAMDIPGRKGALVSEVLDDSPASEARLEAGDVVIGLDDETIDNASELRNAVALRMPDTKVDVTFLRDGQEKQVKVKLGALPDTTQASNHVERNTQELEGLHLAPVDPETRHAYGLPDSVNHGAVITGVAPDSRVARAGLRKGDVILEVDHEPVENVDAVMDAARDTDHPRLLLVQRGDRHLFVVMPVS